MAAMSNYFRNALIAQLYRGASYTFPTTLYVALCTTTPTATSTGSTIVEPSGNYARIAVVSNTTNWTAPTIGSTSNTAALTWGPTNWSATITSVAICDASTTGNLLLFSALTAPEAVTSGNTTTFSIGALITLFQ